MSLQVPPNSTGSVIATNTYSSKEYQENIISDGVTPTTLASVLAPGANLATEVAGLLTINHPNDGHKATYSATYTAQTVGTAATTAIFYIAGSATKTIRVCKVVVSATIATAGQTFDLAQQFETALPTGGTSATAATKIPWDSSSSAATATTKFYTATPTDGTSVGVLWVEKFNAFIAAATTVQPPNWAREYNYGNGPFQAVVLRGATQGLVFTLSTATPGNASSWDVTFVWTEE